MSKYFICIAQADVPIHKIYLLFRIKNKPNLISKIYTMSMQVAYMWDFMVATYKVS